MGRHRQLQRGLVQFGAQIAEPTLGDAELGLDRAGGVDLGRPLLGRRLSDLLRHGVGPSPELFDLELQGAVLLAEELHLVDQLGGSTLALDASSNIVISSTAEQTATLAQNLLTEAFIAGDVNDNSTRRECFMYDLELVTGATVIRVSEGLVEVQREVTS